MSAWKSLKWGIEADIKNYLVDKLVRRLIYKEADLQVWIYFWFHEYYGDQINRQFHVFNQARFEGDETIPDLVVIYDEDTRLAVIEIKDQLGNLQLNVEDILADTRKCFAYLDRFDLAVQVVVHDMEEIESRRLLQGIAKICDDNLNLKHRYHATVLSSRNAFKSRDGYLAWKKEIANIRRKFKLLMS